MTIARGVPVGSGRPGHRRTPVLGRDADRDAGAVTVEAAVSLLALLVVLVALVWCLGLLIAQLTLGEAARAAARAAARGEDRAVVTAEARRLVPEADLDLRVEADHVVIEVHRSVRGPGALAGWGAVDLGARSVAALESSP